MSGRERRKGRDGEREVAVIWRDAGWLVQNLDGQGDHLVSSRTRILAFHCEVKRQERVQLPQWLKQAAAEAPAGTVPVVCFRQSHGEWYAALPLRALAKLCM